MKAAGAIIRELQGTPRVDILHEHYSMTLDLGRVQEPEERAAILDSLSDKGFNVTQESNESQIYTITYEYY